MDVLKKNPLVSVIMSVCNETEDVLKQSIRSILNQTYTNIEFIIILDNPINIAAKKLIYEYAAKDLRILLIENQKNIGLALSLNKAITYSSGEYIARMDADDISKTERLELQVTFMNQNLNIDLLGGNVLKINKDNKSFGIMSAPDLNKYEAIKIIKYRTVAFHPTWLVRKSVYQKVGFYNPLLVSQDYDFLYRAIMMGFKVMNLNKVLLEYRISGENISIENSLLQLKSKYYVHKYNSKSLTFSSYNYTKYIASKKIFLILHSYSTKLFLSAIQEKKSILKIIKLIFSSVISPYQARNFFEQLYYKLRFK